MNFISNTFEKKKNLCCFNGARKRSDSDRFYILIIITLFLLSIVSISGCGSEFEILFDDKESPVIYWTEANGTISRIETDGTGKNTIITLSSTPLDIDVDVQGDRIFWAEYTGSEYRIGRVNLDGSRVKIVHTYSTASNDSGPTSIAIDNSKGTIFWNQYKKTAGHNDIWLSQISLDTLSPVKWINTITYDHTYSICVDTINTKIYFNSNGYYNNGIFIGTGNLGGAFKGDLNIANTYAEKIPSVGPPVISVPLRGIAIDGEGGHVYYAVYTNNWFLRIMRSDLALNNPVPWISSSGFDIQKIALDLVNRKIYWTSATNNSIYRADLDSANSNVEKFLQLSSKPTGIAIPQ